MKAVDLLLTDPDRDDAKTTWLKNSHDADSDLIFSIRRAQNGKRAEMLWRLAQRPPSGLLAHRYPEQRSILFAFPQNLPRFRPFRYRRQGRLQTG